MCKQIITDKQKNVKQMQLNIKNRILITKEATFGIE